ncbi:hypothetical protein [Eisenibacter elegans]|jgi:hypothetical protein|uniref:hypothetical protein n=1 Tax=Eisenibacter elegans TaxID=997 RepID=UPI00041705C8|nr:hypothetical protein [Eisenibacter elegans]
MMDLKDLVLTPLFLLFLVVVLQAWRNSIRQPLYRKQFLPAVRLRLLGAVALGLIYQFYYGGGDTFVFFRDSYHIWDALFDSPFKWLGLITVPANTYDPNLYDYTRRIYHFVDPPTYHVIRVSGFLSAFSFHTYSINALCFGLMGFSGSWALYKAFMTMYPHLPRLMAISALFVPSVVFWGSGLMKDTITFAATGWLFYGFYFGVVLRRQILFNIGLILLSILIIQAIKIYILIAFMPGAIFWIFLQYRARIRNYALRAVLLPFVIVISVPLSLAVVDRLTANNSRYQLDNIAATAKESAEWLEYVASSQGGSVYTLGPMDGTLSGTVRLLPQAIIIAFFRPFLWEVRNPLMLLSALESALVSWLFLQILFSGKLSRLPSLMLQQPFLILCLGFSIVLGFATATGSSNFGTLVRYKIPFMPFLAAYLYIVRYELTSRTKLY